MILTMKKELYTHFLYLNSFFTTTELKLSANDNLEIHELSIMGNTQQTIDLNDNDIVLKTVDSKSNYSSIIPILLLGSLLASVLQIMFTGHIGYTFALLSILLVVTSSVLLLLNSKNKKFFCLYNLSSEIEIYKITIDSQLDTENEIKEFIDEISLKLSNDNEEISFLNNIQSSNEKEDQYSNLIYNLECLYNSGVVDDNTFNRIELNINQKLYPSDNFEKQSVADVIYLHNY